MAQAAKSLNLAEHTVGDPSGPTGTKRMHFCVDLEGEIFTCKLAKL